MLPTELMQGKNFVLWKLKDNKKIPYQINGQTANPTDPNTWSTFEECIKHRQEYNGIGIMLTRASPIICIDIDNCIPLSEELEEFVNSFNSFTELSQSRKGIHIYLKAPKDYTPRRNHGMLNGQEIELYSENRFIAMTGTSSDFHYSSCKEVNSITLEQLEELENLIFPVDENHYKEITSNTGLNEADEVINKLLKAKNGNRFKQLYNGNITGYTGQSEARRGLLWMCIFYTRNEQVLLEILESSNLDKSKQHTKRSGIPFFEYEVKRALNNYRGGIYRDMKTRTINIIRLLIELIVNDDRKLTDKERDELFRFCISNHKYFKYELRLSDDLNIDLNKVFKLNRTRVINSLTEDEFITTIKEVN